MGEGPYYQRTIDTPFGGMRADWTECGLLHAIRFRLESQQRQDEDPSQTTADSSDRLVNGRHENLAAAIADYFLNGRLHWDLELLDWSSISDFHRRVLQLCSQIPAGSTMGYGELAGVAGSPQGARAVGAAMARNRWPIVIPCHRVVGSNGHLTGYSGLGGIQTKRRLLELESRSLLPLSP
jgi:methylated-DNA-[protein]-cysteine S-methyltransferase